MARVQLLYEEAQMLYRKVGNDFGVATTLIESATGLYWFSEGDAATIQTIRHRLQEGQAIVSKLNSRYWLGYNYWLGALIALSERETDRAESLAKESLTIHREIGAPWFIAWALHILGRVEEQRHDLTAARSWYQQSLLLTLELGDKYITPYNMMGLARVLLAQGVLTGAAQLWGAAEALHEGTAPLAPLDRADYEQTVATARAQLGEQAFAAAWAAGRAMSPEQASLVSYQTSSSESVPDILQQPHPPTSTDLTTREMEVLRLLARGLSNAQIAEALVVSLLTVKAHLRSIYSKLGVTSRSSATRYALEHHLD
jgi:ATP/maltotriose-dependent transcriptional regulator MalT